MENRLSDFNYFWLLRSSPLGIFFEMMTKWCLVSNSPPSLSEICMTFFIQWRGIPHLWWYICICCQTLTFADLLFVDPAYLRLIKCDLLLHSWPCASRMHDFCRRKKQLPRVACITVLKQIFHQPRIEQLYVHKKHHPRAARMTCLGIHGPVFHVFTVCRGCKKYLPWAACITQFDNIVFWFCEASTLHRQWHTTYCSPETVISLVLILDRSSLMSSGFMGQNALRGLLGRSLFSLFLYLFYFTSHTNPSFLHAYLHA